MTRNFEGIFAALTTPFEQDRVALDRFRENIEKYNRHDLAGYVIGGSTGESVLLSDDESASLIDTAVKTAAAGRCVIAGTARSSTRHTTAFTNRAADLGAEAGLIVLPHYYKALMTTEALKTHYLSIAEKSKIPIIIYSIPQNTGIHPHPDLFIELSRHPNILGVKDSSGNLSGFADVFPKMADGSIYLLGAGSIILPALLMGASGGILALGAAAPDLCAKLYRLFRAGRMDEAFRLQRKLVPLNQAVTKQYGVPGNKYVLDRRGYFGGAPRLPLQPLDENAKGRIRRILEKLDLPD